MFLPPSATGVIHPGCVMTLSALDQAGFGEAAVRKMRRAGLKVRRSGRKSFVMTDDLLDHLRETSKIIDGEGEAQPVVHC